jgi:hypothetical protein
MASVNPVFLPLVAVGLAVCFASLLICIAIFASTGGHRITFAERLDCRIDERRG